MPREAAVLLAVPNISTGRDEVEARSIAAHPALVDLHSDPDHNRSVLTYGSEPDVVVQACLCMVERAAERLDLRSRAGVHPRFGVVDVLPLVPYGVPERTASQAARTLAESIEQKGVPVRTYGRAASPEISLPELRRQLRSVRGPTHPTAGVVCLGIRDPLVAFNVNLSGSLAGAKRIASRLRSADLRALGLPLASRELVQVSMNLVNPLGLGPRLAHRLVAELAGAEGMEVVDCEMVGLLPHSLLSELEDLPLRMPARSIEEALANR